MSKTAFEVLLKRHDDGTKVPDGDFRNLLVDVITYLKESRGSTIPLPNDNNLVFDNLLPNVEDFFLVISKIVNTWFLAFKGYQICFIDEKSLVFDPGIYSIYPSLNITDAGIEPVASVEADDPNRSFSPYFYELSRSILPIDSELDGVLGLISQGNYARYQSYGAMLFLLDLVWWGWQAWLGEPDGRGEGDISFVVRQNLGLSNLSFECILDLGEETISLAHPENINRNYYSPISTIKIFNASDIDFSLFLGIKDFFGTNLPTHAITLSLGGLLDPVMITDILVKFNPSPQSRLNPIIYSCEYQNDLPLGVVKATIRRSKFSFNKRLINDHSPSGINISVTSKTNLGLLFSPLDASIAGSELDSYILQLFSGAVVLASEYFTIPTNSDGVRLFLSDDDISD